MIVSRSELPKVIERLSFPQVRALDTETTGLRAFQKDALFSIIIASHEESYYFNFNSYPDLDSEWILERGAHLEQLRPIFEDPLQEWVLMNAKFDMRMLWREGLELKGKIHCIEAIARVVKNNELKYSLDVQAKRIGLTKSQAVDEYIQAHKLFEYEYIPGRVKGKSKRKFYDKVPFPIISSYGLNDGDITYKIHTSQQEELRKMDACRPSNKPSIFNIVENEKQFTKTCFEIEKVGIQIDRDYCKRALEYEEGRYLKAAREFEEMAGMPFQDAPSVLEKAFAKAGEEIPRTEKGNPSFRDEVLRGFQSPIAKTLKTYRDAYKKANSYYRNFLFFADSEGVLHPDIRQAGTATGRISICDPALQTLPDEEKEADLPFKIRGAFIPRPGFIFVFLDYKQMEYRMMLDYAGEMRVIRMVQDGMDVHEATGKMFGQPRGTSKTLNFGLLYGMGNESLAIALGVSVAEAKLLRAQYFQGLPFVKGFIRQVMNRAEQVGVLYNWAGRRYIFDDPKFAYKGPNYIIQGGCADAMKIAMNQTASVLEGRRSRMVLQSHDELILEMCPSELHLIDPIQEIMETVYPHKYLRLEVDIEHSLTSWADKKHGFIAA